MVNSKALIIFDWDDTLFPTSWLIENGADMNNIENTNEFIVYFKELDTVLSKLLKISLLYGSVIIITNASIDWIYSSKRLLPLSSRIIDGHIRLISARDMYHSEYDITDWKVRTFRNNIREHIRQSKQIVSIGDAEYEYNALVALNKYIPKDKVLKAIKLVSSPSFDILIDQIGVISKSLRDICNQRTHMDLKFAEMKM